MTKGRRAALIAPLIGAVLLLGAPGATFAAPREGQPPPAEQDEKKQADDKAAKPKPGDQNKNPGQDPKRGDQAAGDKKDANRGEQAAAPKKGKKDNDGRDRDDDD